MEHTPYYFMISQGPESGVRAWLNDVPFYRNYGADPANRTGPAVHLLVPGENTFAIEIDRAPPESQVFFELLLNFDHDHPVVYFEWPRDAKHLPMDARTPFRFEARFTPEGEIFTPAFLAAPTAEIPCDGTPDLREALRRFHAAIEARDVDGFCAGMELKAEEQSRAYPGWPGSSAGEMRDDMRGFFAMDIRVRPLDLHDVHFEGRADGRLACARRVDGLSVIEAIAVDKTPDGEGARLALDPVFTRRHGEWKIIF